MLQPRVGASPTTGDTEGRRVDLSTTNRMSDSKDIDNVERFSFDDGSGCHK